MGFVSLGTWHGDCGMVGNVNAVHNEENIMKFKSADELNKMSKGTLMRYQDRVYKSETKTHDEFKGEYLDGRGLLDWELEFEKAYDMIEDALILLNNKGL